MSLWGKVPDDVVKLIYEFDLTYKEKFNETLKFIKHACPTCCCDGGKKTRYRHHYDIGTFPFTFWDWEWRRRNACPKHNPEDFDKDGNQIEYNWRDMDYNILGRPTGYITNYAIFTQHYNGPDMTIFHPIQNIVIHSDIRTWYGDRYNGINRTINYNIIMLSLWMFYTRNKNTNKIPIKTYSRKKLIGTRFMDMRHNQRHIVA